MFSKKRLIEKSLNVVFKVSYMSSGNMYEEYYCDATKARQVAYDLLIKIVDYEDDSTVFYPKEITKVKIQKIEIDVS